MRINHKGHGEPKGLGRDGPAVAASVLIVVPDHMVV
jgi:hypothetical protein